MSAPALYESKVPTGITGLDTLLCGGLPRDGIYLLQGNPGVGKTTFGLKFLLTGAERGEAGLYISFSETRGELLSVATSHGWDPVAADVVCAVDHRQPNGGGTGQTSS